MKTPEERGPLGAWAYDTRILLDFSPETVVKRIGKYDPATIRKAESDSRKNMSRPLWRALVKTYGAAAAEQGKTLDPIPLFGDDPPTTGTSPDIAALVSLVSDLIDEMRLARAEQAEWNRGVQDVVQRLAERLAPAQPTNGPERVLPEGAPQ